jgi:hypothetical protein
VSVNAVKVMVGQLAPLLLDLAPHLLPVPFDAIPVHDIPPRLLSSTNPPFEKAIRFCAAARKSSPLRNDVYQIRLEHDDGRLRVKLKNRKHSSDGELQCPNQSQSHYVHSPQRACCRLLQRRSFRIFKHAPINSVARSRLRSILASSAGVCGASCRRPTRRCDSDFMPLPQRQ